MTGQVFKNNSKLQRGARRNSWKLQHIFWSMVTFLKVKRCTETHMGVWC